MTIEHTLSIIKPNVVEKKSIGNVLSRFEEAGFRIIGIKMLHLTVDQARGFYIEHESKLFFNDLIDFMVSSPIVVSILESENAIQRYRNLLGVYNPENAPVGTLRADYADSSIKNGIHGSDSIESAAREIAFFFDKREIYSYMSN